VTTTEDSLEIDFEIISLTGVFDRTCCCTI
jgi:hypothetical protein